MKITSVTFQMKFQIVSTNFVPLLFALAADVQADDEVYLHFGYHEIFGLVAREARQRQSARASVLKLQLQPRQAQRVK